MRAQCTGAVRYSVDELTQNHGCCLVTPRGDVGGAPRGGTRPTFDPGDADHFAAAASPVLRGMPAGQRN